MMSLSEANARLTASGERFEIDEEQVFGVPTKTWKNAHRSLREIVESSRAYGDATFLVYEDERLGFDQHYRQVATLARHLVENLGVGKGDRVAVAMRNFPEWSVAFWAAAAVGALIALIFLCCSAIVVPLPLHRCVRYRGEALGEQLPPCRSRAGERTDDRDTWRSEP